MVFKLAKSAEQRWFRLHGGELIAKAITGVRFRDGVELPQDRHQEAAA